ncbi:hypothetical protein ACFSUJ_33500 [Streptomyces lusitanus]|uniref:Uncharacterized protein n=1 Tax=Streptomyces lusitanus TaxID=68232 RepID=A0ABU3JTP1_9ACTN|nr:hypothetical protein [Streptomyces lusitanus]
MEPLPITDPPAVQPAHTHPLTACRILLETGEDAPRVPGERPEAVLTPQGVQMNDERHAGGRGPTLRLPAAATGTQTRIAPANTAGHAAPGPLTDFLVQRAAVP